MTQKTIMFLIVEFYCKPTKKIYVTNKADVYHIDESWSSDILNLNEHMPKGRDYSHVLVVIDIFSKCDWKISLRIKILKQ